MRANLSSKSVGSCTAGAMMRRLARTHDWKPIDANKLELKRRRVMSSSCIVPSLQTAKVVAKSFIACGVFEIERHVVEKRESARTP